MMSTFVVMPEEVMAVDPHMSDDDHHHMPRHTTLWDGHARYVGPAAPRPA